VICLLSSDQTAWNNKRQPFETSEGLFLSLKAKLPRRTNDQNSGSILSFCDKFLFKHLVHQWNQVGKSFTTACGCFDDTVFSLKN
jgi:hypothetical protein